MRLPLREASLLGLALSFAACGGGSDGGSPTSGNLSGSVLNAPNPVSGVKVILRGAGGTFETTTSNDGTYDLTGIPSGTYVVDLCGQGVFDSDGNPIPDKINLHLPRVTVGEGTVAITGKPIFLPEKSSGQTIDTSGTVTGTIPAGTVIENLSAGISIVFEELTTVTFADAADTTISITLIPAEQIPVPLPPNVSATTIVAIEPAGATFDTRPRITFQNEASLPVGTNEVPLYRLDHGTGAWTQFGTGTVSADGGDTILSDVGQGLQATGWHGAMVETFCTTTITGTIENGSGDPVEGALITTVNGRTAVTDSNGEYTVVDVPLPEAGTGVVVTVLPLPDTGLLPEESSTMTGLCGTTTQMGTLSLLSTTIDMTAPTITATSPMDGDEDVADNAAVTVTFDGTMSPGSLNANTISLTAGAESVAGTIGVETVGGITTMTFVPDGLLPLDAACTLRVATGVRDASGNGLEEDATISFDTEASTSGGSPTIAVTPAMPSSMDPGDTSSFSAAVLDAAGAAVGGALVTWTSSDTSVLIVDALGLVTAVAPGTASIEAAFGASTDTVAVTVSIPAIDSVLITGGTASMTVGSSFRLGALARDAGSHDLLGFSFDWTSDNESVATVDAAGNVVAAGAGGPATITATEPGSGENASFAVTVLDPTDVDDVEIDPEVSMLGDNAAVQLSAFAYNSGQSGMAGITFDWASSNLSVARVNANGLVTGVAPGTVQITATADGSTGVSDSIEITVFANTPLVVTVHGGLMGTEPQSDIVVMRFDADQGTFLGEMTTNEFGVADFGLTESPRTTVVCFWDDDPNYVDHAVGLMDVPVGTLPVTLANAYRNLNFGVSGTVPSGTDSVTLDSGFHTEGRSYEDDLPASSFRISSVAELEHQSDGLMSWVATGFGDGQAGVEIQSGGFILDQSPFQVALGLSRQVDLSAQNVTMVPFVAEAAMTHVGGAFRRSGVIFSQEAGTRPVALSGTARAVAPPNTDRFMYSFAPDSANLTAEVTRSLVSSTQPSSFSLTAPDMDVTGFHTNDSYDNIQWQSSGSDAEDLDIGTLRMSWPSKGNGVQWDLIFDGTIESLTLPDLPNSVGSFGLYGSPISYDLKLFGADSINGFDAMVSAIRTHGGRVPSYLMDTVGSFDSATVEGTEMELNIFSGNGTGSVTLDRGEGPETWVANEVIVVEPGQSVSITATASQGSEVGVMFSNLGLPIGVGTSQASVSGDADEPVNVSVRFDALP